MTEGCRGSRGWAYGVVTAGAPVMACLGARVYRALCRGWSRRGSRRPRHDGAVARRVADTVGGGGIHLVPGPASGGPVAAPGAGPGSGPARTGEPPAAGTRICAAGRAGARLGGAAPGAGPSPGAADTRARRSRRRAPGAPPGDALGDRPVSARGHRPGGRTRAAARTRLHPQGRQAGPYPRACRNGRGVADRLWHRVPPATRAPGARAAGRHGRHARLHGAGTDRPDEPLGRCAQRSLRLRRHALPDAHGSPPVHRHRAHGVGPLPHRTAADAARGVGARSPGSDHGHGHETPRQDG